MPAPDLRRPLRGVAPREEPILAWKGPTDRVTTEYRRERRTFVYRILRDQDIRTIRELSEAVEAHFGSAPVDETLRRDVGAVGGARVPLVGNRFRYALLDGETPDSLGLELRDRFISDVLHVERADNEIIIDTSRLLAPALHDLLKAASAERLLPGYLWMLHDGDGTVVVRCRKSTTARTWNDRLEKLLAGRVRHMSDRLEDEE